MSWRASLGRVSTRVVRAAERFSSATRRGLTEREKSVLGSVFESSLDVDAIEVREGVTGLVNLSGRAFVIENTMFVPKGYLPLPDATLVHESTHVWQFQHGGYAYIGDSLHAQTLGDGYDLAKGLRAGLSWAELNCEQQATLIEVSFAQRCFEGRPLLIDGVDFTLRFKAAKEALHSGLGAPS